jgi:hypothetical protein
MKQLALLLSTAVAASLMLVGIQPAKGMSCGESSVRGNLEGENDRVRLSLGGYSNNCERSLEAKAAATAPQPYTTHEIACSADRRAANEGLCSATHVQTSVASLLS